jgi:hypothetical protein
VWHGTRLGHTKEIFGLLLIKYGTWSRRSTQIKITIGAADAFLGLMAGLMEEEDQ